MALKEIAVVHERRGADQEALKWFLQVNRIVKSIVVTGNWSLRNIFFHFVTVLIFHFVTVLITC